MDEDQHGKDRYERCRTPQPLLHARWENRVPRYEMECTERNREKAYYRPEDLGVVQLGVPVRDYNLFGKSFARPRQASGAFLLQVLTTLIFTRNSLLGIMRGYALLDSLRGLSLSFL